MVSAGFTTALLAAGAFVVRTALGQQYPNCVSGPLSSNTVCDTTASVADRARALISELTTEEKFSLTGSSSPGVARLGLHLYQWWQEALHGVAKSPGVNFSDSGDFSHATSFPLPILLGAAFDDQLVHDVASTISTEARAFSNFNRTGLDFWTPNINPIRDPRWGRSLETPGEDAFHLKSYVKALIAGLQGNQDTLKVVATCKHFVAYDLENWHGNERYGFDAQVRMQDLSEYYMQPFQQCARDSNVSSIMCSYNSLNGVPTCADPYILQDVLRDHWGWGEGDGHYVASDCDSIQNIYLPHEYTSTREEAAAEALVAGCDLSCGSTFPLRLGGAFAQGLFNESVIDTALIRLYSALIRLGYFDPAESSEYRSYTFENVSTPNAKALALHAAESGMVLLKNDGLLPYDLSGSNGTSLTVAIVGNWANATKEMLGNYEGIPPFTHSPLYALQQLPNVNAIYASFSDFPTTEDWPAGIRAAEQADLIIFASGLTTADEAETHDRETIAWQPGQLDVGRQLAATGTPLIIAQFGTSLDHSEWLANDNVSAILWCGYPGQDGGTALVNVITGAAAPAGRLPFTIYPAAYTAAVDMRDMGLRPNASSGNPGRTYRWFDSPVLPFGYGLQYTNFSVSVSAPNSTSSLSSTTTTTTIPTFNLTALLSTCPPHLVRHPTRCPLVSLPVTVRNTGTRSSDHVALVFRTGRHGPPPYPRRTLVAYARLRDVRPGEERTVLVDVEVGEGLARVDERGDWRVWIGGGGVGEGEEYAFVVGGEGEEDADADGEGEVDGGRVWRFGVVGGGGGEDGEDAGGEGVLLEKWPQMREDRGRVRLVGEEKEMGVGKGMGMGMGREEL